MTSLRTAFRPLLTSRPPRPAGLPLRAALPALPSLSRAYSTPTSATGAEVRPGPALSQTNRAEATLRRFWKTVHVKEEGDGFLVTLDHRNLKTPGGNKLVLPKGRRLLALLIANEWENQDEVLKQHALPVTSLASRALDGLQDPETRAGVIEAMLQYLETDTILYPNDEPSQLVRLQDTHWAPLLAWLEEAYGVRLAPAAGLAPATQSADTVDRLRAAVASMDGWELAAFERAVYATKSFAIALALVKGKLTAHDAAEAAHVEVRSQIEQWGEVEDTHDVDYQDIRRSLGSVACLLVKA